MTSHQLNIRITNLFLGCTLSNIEATLNYLALLERHANDNNLCDVAEHAQVARTNLSRKLEA